MIELDFVPRGYSLLQSLCFRLTTYNTLILYSTSTEIFVLQPTTPRPIIRFSFEKLALSTVLNFSEKL
jgi:hypothetical protein